MRRTARSCVGVTLLVAASAIAVTPATAAGESRGDRTLTLITGDRVVVHGQGLTVRPAPGRARQRFHIVTDTGHRYVIPGDASALIGEGRVDRRLFDVTRLLADGYDARADIPVIVERSPGVRTAAVPGLRVGRSMPDLGMDAAVVPKKSAAGAWRDLVRPGTTRVWLDGKVRAALDKSVPQIGAPAAWKKGFTGKGVPVAVLDSGYDKNHPDLKGRVVKAKGFTEAGAKDVQDRYGHGTHVASIVAGSGAASKGRYKGVAPGAKLLVGKVLGDVGDGDESGFLAGMEWAAVQVKAKVVNMSLGQADGKDLDPLERAVNTLSARTGALFVVAAGNYGPGATTLDSPGSADAALTVGSVDHADRPAGSSSRGPRIGDGAVKPDVTAPGVGIVAARAAGTGDEHPVGMYYTRMSGTSMATPHVTGAAAILAQQHPTWTGARLKSALIGSARPAGGTTAFRQGAGRIDVAHAVAGPITVDTPNLSAYLRWPNDEPLKRTVTYRNDSARPVTFRATLKIDQPEGRPAARLDRDKLTVPAHGTASLTLTLTGSGVKPGKYSGVIEATGKGVSVRTVVGAYIEPRSHDLTIKTLDAAGKPVAAELTLYSRDLRTSEDVRTKGGTLKLRVQDGAYNLAGIVEASGRVLLVNRPVTVGADLTITLDGRRGKRIGTTVDEPTARREPVLDVGFAYTNGSRKYAYQVSGECPPESVSVLPARQRGLSFYDHTVWARSGATAGKPSPYRYEVVDHRTGELPTDPTYKARTARMATLTSTFKAQGVAQQGSPQLSVLPPGFDEAVTTGPRLTLPATLTYHLTVDRGLKWRRSLQYGVLDDGGVASSEIWAAPRSFGPGSHRETWNEAVIGPAVDFYQSQGAPVGRRQGDVIKVSTDGLHGDGAVGHPGSDSNVTGTARLARDGRVIKTAAIADGISATVPAAGAAYTVTTTGTRKVGYAKLSTKVELEWRFRSSTKDQGPLPLHAVGFTPQGLDPLNRAKPRSTTPLPIRADGRTEPKVWASFDDGRTWKPLKLTAGTAKIVNPASGYVSLRATLTDQAGNSVKETIIRAYGIA